MAESIHEQLSAALETSLGQIVGDGGATYWETPGAVTRSAWGDEDESLLNALIEGPIYAIRPGEEIHSESDPGTAIALAPFAILLAHKYDFTETAFEVPALRRMTLVNRMVRDVLRKLLADVKLGAFSQGGLVENVFQGDVIVDRNKYAVGWALAEIAFVSKYRYFGGVP